MSLNNLLEQRPDETMDDDQLSKLLPWSKEVTERCKLEKCSKRVQCTPIIQ